MNYLELEPIKLARQEGDELLALRLERDLLVTLLESCSVDWQAFQAQEAEGCRRILRLLENIRGS